MRTLLITAHDAALDDLAALTVPHLRDYAARHGHAFEVVSPDLGDRSAYWSKIAALREALARDVDLVVWVDVDIVVQRGEHDIAIALPGDKDLGLCFQGGPSARILWPDFVPHPNVGVMWARPTPFARGLLDRVWTSHAFDAHVWPEQATLLDLMGYRAALGIGRPDEPDPTVMADVALIDPTWNSVPGVVEADHPIIHHYAGLKGDLRLDLVRRDVETLRWRASLPEPGRREAGEMMRALATAERHRHELGVQLAWTTEQLGVLPSLKRLASAPKRYVRRRAGKTGE